MSSNKAAKFIAVWMMAMAVAIVGIAAIGAMSYGLVLAGFYIHSVASPYVTSDRFLFGIVILMVVGITAVFARGCVYGDDDA